MPRRVGTTGTIAVRTMRPLIARLYRANLHEHDLEDHP